MNLFRESSASVLFFASSLLDPTAYRLDCIFDYAEELVVDTDPEYEWSDNFRTARKSNESRQQLLYRLAHSVRRQIGKKAIEQAAML